MKPLVLICTALVAAATLTACADDPPETTEGQESSEAAPSTGSSATASGTAPEEATSFPGTATRQELLVASVEVPDGVPFEDTTESYRPDSVDRTWLVGAEDAYECAVILSVWYNARGWTFEPEQGYTGDGVDPGVTVASQGADPAPLTGTTHPYLAVEAGPSGTVTPAFLGDTTHVYRTYASPDERTRVDLNVTALDDYVGCDPEAIASTLAWDGDQFDDTTWESARTEYATY